MATILGQNFLIYQVSDEGKYKQMGYSRACVVDERREVIEVNGPTTGSWREYISGRRSWEGSSDNLLTTNIDEFENAFRSSTPLNISFRDRNANTENRDRSGKMFITSITITARKGEMATCSIKFQGTGPLAYSTKVVPPEDFVV